MHYQQLNNELGNIDLYLLDQILKGRFEPSMKILDAGSGEGRNLMYFIRNAYDVYAIDKNPGAIQMLQFVARTINPDLDKSRFITGNINELPYPGSYFDIVLSSAVMHFANNHQEFHQMVEEQVRVLKRDGIFFIRMASNIGIEHLVELNDDGKAMLPDGSFRYLLTRGSINELISKYRFAYPEPVKTVNVQDQRCMTTLVLKKEA